MVEFARFLFAVIGALVCASLIVNLITPGTQCVAGVWCL
jgi:hypothetical protein